MESVLEFGEGDCQKEIEEPRQGCCHGHAFHEILVVEIMAGHQLGKFDTYRHPERTAAYFRQNKA